MATTAGLLGRRRFVGSVSTGLINKKNKTTVASGGNETSRRRQRRFARRGGVGGGGETLKLRVSVGKDGFPLEEDFPSKRRQVAPLLYVSQVMNSEVVCLNENDTLRDALGLFLEKKVSGAPVVNSEGGLIGVLSMTDIIWVESTEAMQEVEFPFYPTSSVEEDEEEVEEGRNIAADQILTSAETEAMLNMRVSSRMSKSVMSIEPQDLLDRAAALMIERNINRLPVVHPATRNSQNSNGKVVGIITRLDIMRCLAAVWL